MKANEKAEWEQEYLTDIQVAKIIGRAVGTLRNERSLGRGLPFVKIGRSVRYKIADVHSFMDSRRVDPEN